MQNLQPVKVDKFCDKSWNRPKDFSFAIADPIVVLGGSEVPKIIMGTAVAFVPENEDFLPVAVQGIKQGQNLLVDQRGQWRESYVPAIYRSYPFRLARGEEDNYFLCVDEGSGLVKDDKGGAELFYDDARKLAEHTKNALDLLVEIERDRKLAIKICKALTYMDVIEPWPLVLETQGEKQQISGLFRISEEKLNDLPPEKFAELREGGALLLAYCQLLSMQHIHKLGRLALLDARTSKVQTPIRTSEFSLGGDIGTLSFENL